MNRTINRTLAFVPVILVLLTVAPTRADENWPQFRGLESRGIAHADALPVRWSATDNIEWKAEIPGRGWSSPIVWGGRVFLTTVVNQGESEKPTKGLYFGGNRPVPKSVHQWKVYCLDLETGRVIWQRQVHQSKPETSIHLKNSFASETPVTDGQHVYVTFGNVGIFCFDFEGELVWQKKLTPHKTRYGWGTAASPVLHQDRLYFVDDNDEDSSLLALNKKTGDEVWRVPRDEKSNWATPYIWQHDRRTEIITPGSGKVRSYDLDGNLLWWLKGMSSITIATPYEHNGLLYVSSGYVGSSSRPIYAIRPGAKGDVSLDGEETSNEWIAWCQKKGGPYNPTTLTYNDRLFVLYDRGQVTSFDPQNGTRVLERQRIPGGKGFTSSPWAYNGKIFCLDEDGVTFVLTAGDTFELLHKNTLQDDDMCMATPAMAGDRLLIRSAARLYCIREGATGGNSEE
jgi:outer membrane protein assembly factor BamB